MTRAKGIWEELGLPALTPQAPWYGYSLGDWTDRWTQDAEAAVAGDWYANGESSYARRKAGIKPETPVRDVKDKD
jgi:4-hydroxy-3-polyprenylbenzoate decarboxylase